MKFFDLEMNDCLGIIKKKGGSRTVEYKNRSNSCNTAIFHGGMTWQQCKESTYNSSPGCLFKTTIEADDGIVFD